MYENAEKPRGPRVGGGKREGTEEKGRESGGKRYGKLIMADLAQKSVPVEEKGREVEEKGRGKRRADFASRAGDTGFHAGGATVPSTFLGMLRGKTRC